MRSFASSGNFEEEAFVPQGLQPFLYVVNVAQEFVSLSEYCSDLRLCIIPPLPIPRLSIPRSVGR